MRSLHRLALLGALLSSFVTTASAADFGRTRGALSVSGGVAHYTVPIWTPPGPNGLQPDIALQYRSDSSNGLPGVGWSLSATSAIERCARTVAQDGSAGPVDFTTSDRLCIDGKRLRLVNGTHLVAGSIYFTELADFSRVTSYGALGNAPEYFVVDTKDGLRYEYGRTPDSRVMFGSGSVLRWMLNKVSDRSGNHYTLAYINNRTGFAFPSSIRWTPVSHGATTYRYEAQFNYWNARPDKDSFIGKMLNSIDLINRYRLENIQIKSNGAVVRSYFLGYDTSTVTARSRLTSVKECASADQSNCLLPLSFAYQVGVGGLTAGTGSVPAVNGAVLKGRFDFDGDRRNDLVYQSGSTWYVARGADDGFEVPVATGAGGAMFVDRFLPNGRDAIATVVNGVLWIHRWDDATAAFTSVNTGVPNVTIHGTADYDGDGLADLLSFTPTGVYVRGNLSANAGGAPSFAAVPGLVGGPGNGEQIYKLWTYGGAGLRRMDLNGDGRQDFYVALVKNNGTSAPSRWIGTVLGAQGLPSAASSWEKVEGSTERPYPALNFNGDRCTDRYHGATIYLSACNGGAATQIATPVPLEAMDWDADGRDDILSVSAGTVQVNLSAGSSIGVAKAADIPAANYFPADVDGDGMDDLVQIGGSAGIGYWTHNAAGYVASDFATNVPDLLWGVTDGFGAHHAISYASTARGNYYDDGADTPYPLQKSAVFNVVARLMSSNGIGGTYARTYYYSGSRTDALRGTASFQRIDETDGRNGIVQRVYFDQAFPLTGMVKRTEVMQPGGVKAIARQELKNEFAWLDNSPNNGRYFVYPASSAATQYEVGGAFNGELLRTVSTTNKFSVHFGALYDQTVTTSEPAGANGVSAGSSWTTRTFTPPEDLLYDPDSWCVGRPRQVKHSRSHTRTGGEELVRTTGLTWDAQRCRLTQTIDEPGNTKLQVTTDLGYDVFGNVSSTVVTGIGMDPRPTKTNYSNGSLTTGQFPLSIENALGQVAKTSWNYDVGVPVSAEDANGIQTTWRLDSYGRRIRENRADGTFTTWEFLPCGGCAPRGQTFVRERESTASAVFGQSMTVLDELDRPIYEYRLRPTDGHFDMTLRAFDALGRLTQDYLPFRDDDGPVGSVTYAYDLVNRRVATSRPISDTNPGPQSSTSYYEGLTTRFVDAQGKQTTRVTNAAGQLARSVDHDGYFQSFEYDAFGNPTTVTDRRGDVLQTSTYGLRGALERRVDMDMGAWSFASSALGETVSQTDARNLSTKFEYDLLGRLVKRAEPEGVSTWTWGASKTAKNVGSLVSVAGPNYSESYAYDSLGRPARTTVQADAAYDIDYSYNDIGALDTLTYPASTSGYRLGLKYEYQNGTLMRIRDLAAPDTVFWAANLVDPRGRVTRETLGNGLVTTREFDALTGALKTIKTGKGTGSGVQNLAYSWDLTGNLLARQDFNQAGLTETFAYDDLYRLKSAVVGTSSSTAMTYDELGNILTKTGVGTYTYDAVKKHQLKSTTSHGAFTYDENGNMTSGRGAVIAWTNANYPKSITKGTDTAAFEYTPDRRYWKQTANYTSSGPETTVYIAGLLEKVTASGVTDFRHMIRAGGASIIVSRKDNGSNAVYYTTSDHLGSSSVLTDRNGVPLLNASFDAFGKRRGANWTGTPTTAELATIMATTRRGYTSHTMLDNLELVHMNGRVQDSLLGRFVSADPFITEPFDTQGYNRYSYVSNGPLTFTDLSGFVKDFDRAGFPSPTFTCDGAVRSGCAGTVLSLPHLGVQGVGYARAAAEAISHPNVPSLSTTGSVAPSSWSGTTEDSPSLLDRAGQFLAPNIAEFGRRGIEGTWQSFASGAGKAFANTLLSMAAAGTQGRLVPGQLAIDSDELGGAAVMDGVTAIAGALRVLGGRGVVARSTPAQAPIIIGENMKRVREYAARFGAETFEGSGMAANRSWVQAARDAGRKVIDIGPDFDRRITKLLNGERPDSIFYGMEREVMKGYENVLQIWERTGKYSGVVVGGP